MGFFEELRKFLKKLVYTVIVAWWRLPTIFMDEIMSRVPGWNESWRNMIFDEIFKALGVPPFKLPPERKEDVFGWVDAIIKETTGLDLSFAMGGSSGHEKPGGEIESILAGAAVATMFGSIIYPMITGGLGEWVRQHAQQVWRPALLDLSYLRDAKFRGIMSDSDVDAQLRRYGFTDGEIGDIKKIWEYIPPISDVITFLVREVYIPERRAELLTGFDRVADRAIDEARKRGMSEETIKDYWAAHWRLPPVEDLRQFMYQSRLTAGHPLRTEFSEERFKDYIRYHDYEPTQIDNYVKTIYNPITRVDIRRMWDLALVTEDDVRNTYRRLGYADEDVEKLVLWTKVYTLESDLRSRYSKGWLDENGVRQELLRVGVPAARVDELVQTIVRKAKPERTAEEKDLTRAQVLALYRNRVVGDAVARDMLRNLGYDDDEIDLMFRLEDLKVSGQVRELTTSNILSAYRYKIIDRDEAKRQLIEIDYDERSAEILLSIEDKKREGADIERQRERDLTTSTIIKAYKIGAVTLDVLREYLAYLGYSDWEIDVLLKVEGIIPVS